MSWYQRGKTSLDFTEARDSEWHSGISWAVCKSGPCSRQKTPPPRFLQAGCPSCRPTNSQSTRQSPCPVFTNFLCMLPTMSVARCSYGSIAICYIFAVLWITCFYIIARNRGQNSDSVWSSIDLLLWHILKLTHRGQD